MTAAIDRVAVQSALPRLSEQLARSGRRAVAAGGLAALAVGLAAGCVGFGIARLAAAFAAPTSIGEIGVAAIAASIAFVAALAVALLARPRTIDLARRADRLFSLRERVSTSLELAGRTPTAALGEALFRDAETNAATLNARALAPLRLDRVALILSSGLAFLAVALLIAAMPGTVEPPAMSEAAPATIAAADQAELSEDLRRVAALISEDAEQRADPFLQAIARETAALGARIEAGEIIERSEIVAQLDRLATYAGDAYAAAGETAGGAEDLSRLLEAVGDRLEPAPDLPPSQVDAASLDGDPRPEGTPAAPGDAPAPGEPHELDSMLSELEREASDQSVNPSLGNATDTVSPDSDLGGGDYRAVAAAQAAELAARAAADREADGAQLAGAAEESRAGDSRLAGEGVAGLDGQGAETDPFAVAGELVLQDEIDGEGRRIRVEVPPPTAPVELAPGEISAGDWRAAPESEVARAVVPLPDRGAVGRYFRALAEAAE